VEGSRGRQLSADPLAAMRQLVRWVFVPLSGIAVWYAVLLLGIAGVGLLDRFCPPELMVSGACTASWHAPAVDALIFLCTAVVSAGIVLVPAFLAPSYRFQVAALAFAGGAAFALYAASGGSLWGPFFVSTLAGSASLWLAASKWRRPRIAA
jgi:hypothetical protein